MSINFGVLVFPGTWSDSDWEYAIVDIAGSRANPVFHKQTDLSDYDCIVIPGGFSFGDYLRPGAIAHFSPVMQSVKKYAANGGVVIGSCNGFQILCEAGLLPGTLMRNEHLEFRCQEQFLKVEKSSSPFTSTFVENEIISIPISHGDGNYHVSQSELKQMEDNNQILLRYCYTKGDITKKSNPNGSVANIAGVTNLDGNVFGLMPHPERVVELKLGGVDGLRMIQSIISNITAPSFSDRIV